MLKAPKKGLFNVKKTVRSVKKLISFHIDTWFFQIGYLENGVINSFVNVTSL